MANTAGLKITIGADIAGAINGFNAVSDGAAKLGAYVDKSFSTASAAAVNLGNTLDPVSKVFVQTANASKSFDKAAQNINTAGDAAAQAGFKFSALYTSVEGLSKSAVAFRVFNANAQRFPLAPLENYRKSVQELKRDLEVLALKKDLGLVDVSKGANAATGALKGTRIGADQAGQALSNVGRVAQDLPFGFIGIQNNLNPLLESFQRLKTASGSTGGALKALAGSLLGAGGIGLALSVVSAAFLIYQNGIAGFNKKSKEAKQEADSYAASLKSIGDELASQATRATTLVSALESSNLPLEQRKQALKELKGISNDYFGSLKEEQGSITGLVAAYDSYINQLEKLGKAKAIQEQISKLFSERLQLELNISPEFIAATSPETQKKLGDLRKRLEELGGAIDVTKQKDTNVFADGNKNIRERIELQGRIRKLEGGVEFFQDGKYQADKRKIDDITLRIEGLRKLQSDLGTFDIKVPASSPTGDKSDQTLKRLKDELQGYQKQLEVTNKLRDAGLISKAKENAALELQIKILDKLNEIDAREVEIKIKPKLEIDRTLNALELQKAITEYTQRVAAKPIGIDFGEVDATLTLPKDGLIPANAFDKTIARMVEGGERVKKEAGKIILDLEPVIRDGFANAAVAIGEGIGDLISGLGAGGLLKGFANTLADIISTIGKMLIQAGAEFIVLKKLTLSIASTGGAALAIAGGIAAVALAAALRNKVNEVRPRPFATGALVTGPTYGLIGEAGPEVVFPLDKLGSMINPAGSGNIVVNGRLAISGRDLVAFIQRESASFNRSNG